ncbi:MAG: alginate lyase family protein, partial [Anaerolineales bacterium]|nr:alginate lyase family protein [Anaerolineales bacterium]
MNGQEVALRLMALAWSGQIFASARASTAERQAQLAQMLAIHAARIPPTLLYARAQHNNHLLTEAAALFTAGVLLPKHPSAARWRLQGWRWLNDGLQTQIDSYGEYAQHSTNYHRLMLQVVLWVHTLVEATHGMWPALTLEAVRRAVHWLLSLLDPVSGSVPNLGANDGAYIFPLTVCPFSDFRPVAHAAARAFLEYEFPAGLWDEMSLWFGAQARGPKRIELTRYPGDHLYGQTSWAYLRTGQFSSRPSHADQLHLDLWQNGVNVTLDAGTYSYNAPPPWTNALTAAAYHNTVTVNGKDQMTRAGRFLYLDWVQAYRRILIPTLPSELQRLSGRYRGRGYRHLRTVSLFEGERWLVRDEILALEGRSSLRARLHWLLPDWEWKIE